jgi:hypothetical protein
MKMEQTECPETSAYKIQTPGNYPEENIQHTEHGESLKSRRDFLFSTSFQTGPGANRASYTLIIEETYRQ